jgi:hypothetical protein
VCQLFFGFALSQIAGLKRIQQFISLPFAGSLQPRCSKVATSLAEASSRATSCGSFADDVAPTELE